jgi:hypothetical protein
MQDNFCEYYLNFQNPDTNENPDFICAGGQNGFPDIAIDANKIPMAFWNNTLQYISKFEPINGAEAIYLYDSESNDPEWENMVCGQRFCGDFKLYVLGFPLYYMNQSSAAQIVDLVMQDFGEVTNFENNTITYSSVTISNYPNPFNPSTTISFSIELNKPYELSIYNLKGQKVKVFSPSSCHAELFEARGTSNNYSVVWNGTDQNNKPVSSGIYFARLNINGKEMITNKMLLLK